MDMSTTAPINEPCRHCGSWHTGQCERVKAVEYYPDGTLKRVEYHGPPAIVAPVMPPPMEPLPFPYQPVTVTSQPCDMQTWWNAGYTPFAAIPQWAGTEIH